MIKQILLTGTLLAAISLPAFAGEDTAPMSRHDGKDMKDMKQMAPKDSDAGFYVAAFGGAQFDTDYGNQSQTTSVAGANGEFHPDLHSHWGGVGGIKGGYNFESFPICDTMSLRLQPAVEAEGMYIGSNEVHSTGGADGLGIPATQHFSTNSGDFFINGILRFKNSSMVTPYVGVGAGLQYFSIHSRTDLGGGSITGITGDDLDFAAQALVGFDVAITKHISIFSEYKFVDALGTDAKVDNIGGGPATFRFKPDQIEQNLITAGVKYSF